jgi:hypothetical protein
MDTLDEYVRAHDYDLELNAASAQTGLSMGTAVAGWLTEAVFGSAEQRLALSAAAAGAVFPTLGPYPGGGLPGF